MAWNSQSDNFNSALGSHAALKFLYEINSYLGSYSLNDLILH